MKYEAINKLSANTSKLSACSSSGELVSRGGYGCRSTSEQARTYSCMLILSASLQALTTWTSAARRESAKGSSARRRPHTPIHICIASSISTV